MPDEPKRETQDEQTARMKAELGKLPEGQKWVVDRQQEIDAKARELAEVVLRGTGMSPDETPVLVQSQRDVLKRWQEEEEKNRKPS